MTQKQGTKTNKKNRKRKMVPFAEQVCPGCLWLIRFTEKISFELRLNEYRNDRWR